MPIVRGRILPEIKSTGRVKRTLDVLVSARALDRAMFNAFDELELLRIYLASFRPPVCEIRLLAPKGDSIFAAFGSIGIEILPATTSHSIAQITKEIADALPDSLRELLATALDHDADCVVTNDRDLLPYVEEFGKAGVLLTSPDFLLRYAEMFVRGHDVPWAFANKVWFAPWMSFYQLSERWTFESGMHFLELCQKKSGHSDASEFCRSLVYNRLGDLSFSRDRLCFLEMQQLASKRAQWRRQRFSAEIAYYLNFYYLQIHGAFDHAAVLVNALFALGVKERQVTARNPEFLNALTAQKLDDVRAVFEKPGHLEFIKRIAALRHTAAHRGVLTPTKVVQTLDHPPTNDELDQDIREAGLEYLIFGFPDGDDREKLREMLRSNARAARYEKETLMEDVLLIELDGKYGFIHPLNDTCWNFNRCTSFLADVFAACAAALV